MEKKDFMDFGELRNDADFIAKATNSEEVNVVENFISMLTTL